MKRDFQPNVHGEGWVRGYKCQPLTEEHKKKISEQQTGIWWWTDGINNIRAKNSPGEEWKRGRTLINRIGK